MLLTLFLARRERHKVKSLCSSNCEIYSWDQTEPGTDYKIWSFIFGLCFQLSFNVEYSCAPNPCNYSSWAKILKKVLKTVLKVQTANKDNLDFIKIKKNVLQKIFSESGGNPNAHQLMINKMGYICIVEY